MKTVVVPIDFASTVSPVIDYAAQLALHTKAKLVLYHAFFEPYAVTETPVQLPSRAELIASNTVKLQSLGEKLKQQYPIQTEYDTSPFPFYEGLEKVVDQKNADLVLMGLQDAQTWERIFFGSSTAETIRRADFPVLVIPEHVTYHAYKRMLFACDYNSLTLKTNLSLLKKLATIFGAEVQVLYVELSSSHASGYSRIDLHTLLQDVELTYTRIETPDLMEGIEKGISGFKPDLLVMMPHKHSFWDILLNKSTTRKMLFKTNIPLLALPQEAD